MAVLGAYVQESREMMNSMRNLIMFKDFLEKSIDQKGSSRGFMPFP